MAPCVFQDWMLELTMQQQSVLVLACRGPDGVGKFHPTKALVARYRATVLKAAYLGRPMLIDEGDATTFMTLRHLSQDGHWEALLRDFFDNVDELPHHYYMHLMHGAQIAGYKHSDDLFRKRWSDFYLADPDDIDEIDDDALDDDDGLDECGLMDDGQCMQAGTEHCDFSCPWRDSDRFAGSEAWNRSHGDASK